MSAKFHAYAAQAKGKPLVPYEFDPGPLRDNQVEIKVQWCGICHSDLSMIDNEWGLSAYPLVAGHEVVGEVVSVGRHAKKVKVGDRVGLGWQAGCCMSCRQCFVGDQNLCLNAESTIIGRHGGFADRVRCDWEAAIPLPEGLDPATAGPLFCGGITVFNPLLEFGIRPTDRAAVIGIGGLGHMALQFLNKWGCDVTAFTSSESKHAEALKLGAHHAVNSRDSAEIGKLAGSFDFLLSTVNVPLDWESLLETLAPKGRLHLVGAVLQPIPVNVPSLIGGQKSVSASPIGSFASIEKMLDFSARHEIAPRVETFPMSQVNEALHHLRSNRPRYRIVLENDL